MTVEIGSSLEYEEQCIKFRGFARNALLLVTVVQLGGSEIGDPTFRFSASSSLTGVVRRKAMGDGSLASSRAPPPCP